MSDKKKHPSSREARRMRTQQIIFSIIAIMIILVMVIGLFARY
jgi:predicted nucleic acid-binding Zn ribbon protein